MNWHHQSPSTGMIRRHQSPSRERKTEAVVVAKEDAKKENPKENPKEEPKENPKEKPNKDARNAERPREKDVAAENAKF